MIGFIKQFIKDESGAISVEWTVLTAGIVGLTIAAFSIVEVESQQLASNTGATIEAWDTTTANVSGVSGQ